MDKFSCMKRNGFFRGSVMIYEVIMVGRVFVLVWNLMENRLLQESILLWQRKCEDALFSFLTLGARRPVRHLASVAMARIIFKGDGIAIYSRASSLQGFLSDGRRGDPNRVAG